MNKMIFIVITSCQMSSDLAGVEGKEIISQPLMVGIVTNNLYNKDVFDLVDLTATPVIYDLSEWNGVSNYPINASIRGSH